MTPAQARAVLRILEKEGNTEVRIQLIGETSILGRVVTNTQKSVDGLLPIIREGEPECLVYVDIARIAIISQVKRKSIS